MKKENKKIIITLILIALTLVFAGVMSFIACEEANAEYADIILNPQSTVNFNQQFNLDSAVMPSGDFTKDNTFIYVNGNSAFELSLQNTVNIYIGHKYYIKITTDTNIFLELYSSSLNYGANFDNTTVYTGELNAELTCYIRRRTAVEQVSSYVAFNVIDLTLMFGEGNEPNLAQSNELFTANYYNYTTGTPMALGSINVYQQALSDILSSFKYQLKTSAIGLNSFSYKYDQQDAYFQFNEQYNNWYFLNTFATPLFTKIESGVLFTINYNLWGPNSGIQNALHLAIGYIDEQNNYILLKTDTQPMNFFSDEVQSFSFTLPVAVDTLYFNIYDDTTRAIDTEANYFVLQFDISADKLDITTAIANAYTRGVESQLENYKPGGIAYQVIYNEGYMDATSNPANGSIFTDGWSWIGTMFHAIGEIFSMTLLPGVPLGLFIALPLLLGVIFFVVKVSKGGGE